MVENTVEYWKAITGFETPEECVEAVNARFAEELPKGLAKSLWLLEQRENVLLRAALKEIAALDDDCEYNFELSRACRIAANALKAKPNV